MAATGATVVTLAGGQAAVAVSINFGGSNLTTSSISDTVGGIGYTATGFSSNGNDRNVVRRSSGLGVQFSGGLSSLENPQIDGLGFDETLRLNFNQIVTLTSASFSGVGDFTLPLVGRINDEVRLIVDGVLFSSADIPGGNFLGTDQGTFTSLNITGKVFDFTVTDNNDSYFLSSIEVEPVPEPFTILGSLSALGAGTLMKKQHDKRQNKVKSDA